MPHAPFAFARATSTLGSWAYVACCARATAAPPPPWCSVLKAVVIPAASAAELKLRDWNGRKRGRRDRMRGAARRRAHPFALGSRQKGEMEARMARKKRKGRFPKSARRIYGCDGHAMRSHVGTEALGKRVLEYVVGFLSLPPNQCAFRSSAQARLG